MAIQKVNKGLHKKKNSFSFPDPSPFLPTSVPHSHTEPTLTLFQVTWPFPHGQITQYSSSQTEATITLRPLQVLVQEEGPGLGTPSSIRLSPTSLYKGSSWGWAQFLRSSNKRPQWVINKTPVKPQRQKEHTQRGQSRKFAQLMCGNNKIS